GDRAHFEAVIDDMARRCFVPLACGGRIRSTDDVRRLLRIGADKVILNTGAVEHPQLVSEASALFGAQCVVVSVDPRRPGPGRYEVYTRCGSEPTGMEPAEWAARAQALGAGEILITAIEKDGSLEGYDND